MNELIIMVWHCEDSQDSQDMGLSNQQEQNGLN